MKKLFIMALALAGAAVTLFPVQSFAQQHNENVWEYSGMNEQDYRYNIKMPDILGYKVLKCDFHIHTVFSDGQVWPIARVNEAWNDGLDCIAMTDHIEVRKNKTMLISDLNESNKIAMKRGKEIGLLVIPGIEITRAKPFGHMNALFIQDANKLEVKNPEEALEEAHNQGAFILWNHPGWPNDTATMYPNHEKWLKEKKINGIEVFNGREAYPLAMDWTIKYGVGQFSNTDLHYLSGYAYRDRLERPITLVLAKEKTAEAVKEALFAGRTIAFFRHDMSSSHEEYLREMVKNCLSVTVIDAKKGIVEIANSSDINFQIKFGKLEYSQPVHANQILRIALKKGTPVTFTNCFVGTFKNLTMPLW